MKKLTLLVLCLLFLLMLAACVDYSAIRDVAVEEVDPEPSASEELMVRMSAYEELMDNYNTLSDQLNALLDEQETGTQQEEALVNENTALNAVVSEVELSVYRSVISKETLGAFFGMITGVEKLDNGDVVLTVQPLSMVNEPMDTSLYDKDVIKQIYTGLTLQPTSEPEARYTLTSDTVVAYNGETHYALDSGFYTYVADEIVSAQALYDESSAAQPTLLPGPVFIFLAMGDDSIMVLEK